MRDNMSDGPANTPDGSASLASLLAGLEQLLANLIERAPREGPEAIAPLLAQVDILLAAARRAPQEELFQQAQILGRILRRHRRLCLIFADKKRQAAEALSRMTSRKGALRAYGAAEA